MSRNPKALPQLVYHGSPHRGIETFSTDKVGTGEGAQVFGWGLYFAGLREVAQWYRETLSRDFGYKTPQVKAALAGATNFADGAWRGLRDVVQTSGGDAVIAAQWLEKYALRSTGPDMREAYCLMAQMVRDGDIVLQTEGQLYEVEIPDDSQMLLWDEPVYEYGDAAIKVNALIKEKFGVGGYFQGTARTGGGFYGSVGKAVAKFTGRLESYSEQLTDAEKRIASEFLLAAGIKGIKYLDGTSRSAGEGTFNYVIFDGTDAVIKDVCYSMAAKIEPPPFQPFLNIEALSLVDTPSFKAWFSGSKIVDPSGAPLVVYHGSDDGGFFKFDRRNAKYGFFASSQQEVARSYVLSEGQTSDPAVPKNLWDLENDGFSFEDSYGDDWREINDGAQAEMFFWLDGTQYGPFEDLDSAVAAAARRGKEGPSVYGLYMSLQNPFVIDWDGRNWDDGGDSGFANTNEAAQYAESSGHDGLIIQNVVDSGAGPAAKFVADNYVAFRPEQIKSAIGNRGIFCPDNPDIRCSSTPSYRERAR